MVDAAEFRRAHLLLAELCAVQPVRLLGEWRRCSGIAAAWSTPGNAWSAVFSKDPSEPTRADAMTLCWGCVLYAMCACLGFTAINEAAGLDDAQWLGEALENRLFGTTTHAQRPSEKFLEKISLQMLEIVREPNGSAEVAAGSGAFHAIVGALGGRTSLAMTMIEGGILDVGLGYLQQSSPTDWVSWRTPAGFLAGNVCALGWTLSTLPLPNKAQLLLSQVIIMIF